MEETKLGNLHHGKVSIVFEDDEGVKQVDTTIWATGLKYICLSWDVVANFKYSQNRIYLNINFI